MRGNNVLKEKLGATLDRMVRFRFQRQAMNPYLNVKDDCRISSWHKRDGKNALNDLEKSKSKSIEINYDDKLISGQER